MAISFLKMHGCGNDFVVTHVTNGALERLVPRVSRICDRRTGVGADGVIVVGESRDADLRMRIWNADGSEAEMCGNGIRCAFVYAGLKGLAKSGKLVFETGAGRIVTEESGARVRVNMGAPVLAARKIPVDDDRERVVGAHIEAGGKRFEFTAVSMGNPHAVIHVDTITDELVLGYGPKIETHPYFPRKVNVEFATVLAPDRVRMRVWERGVGETMACGTGACAVAVAGVLGGKHGNAVTVELPGGELSIEWRGTAADPVYMTGPALVAFEGQLAE